MHSFIDSFDSYWFLSLSSYWRYTGLKCRDGREPQGYRWDKESEHHWVHQGNSNTGFSLKAYFLFFIPPKLDCKHYGHCSSGSSLSSTPSRSLWTALCLQGSPVFGAEDVKWMISFGQLYGPDHKHHLPERKKTDRNKAHGSGLGSRQCFWQRNIDWPSQLF